MKPRHLMTCYQKVTNDITVNEKKYSKFDDWILQTTQQPFRSHNERSFYKTNPQV